MKRETILHEINANKKQRKERTVCKEQLAQKSKGEKDEGSCVLLQKKEKNGGRELTGAETDAEEEEEEKHPREGRPARI